MLRENDALIDGLTDRETAFIEAYLGEALFNASEAARIAGYQHPFKAGYAVKSRPKVKAILENRLQEMTLTANEVLARISEQATFDISDFCDIGRGGALRFDLAKAKKAGKLHLLMGVEYAKNGKPVYKFADAQAALFVLAKHYGLVKERVEIGSEDALSLLRGFLGGKSEPEPEQDSGE